MLNEKSVKNLYLITLFLTLHLKFLQGTYGICSLEKAKNNKIRPGDNLKKYGKP